MRGVVTLVVLMSLALAGCGDLTAQDQPAIEETVTPAPVPSTTPVADARPDRSRDGLTPDKVAVRHHEALANESYTLTRTVQWESPNNTSHRGHTAVAVGRDGDRHVLDQEYPRSRGTLNRTSFDVWYDGDRSVVRSTFAEGPPEYQRFESRTYEPDAGTAFVRDLFARLTDERVSGRDDGSTVVQGSLEPVTNLNAPQAATETANGSMSARVHPDGYVHRIAVGYDATVDGSTVRVREETTVSDVGETTLTEPTWVENATG